MNREVCLAEPPGMKFGGSSSALSVTANSSHVGAMTEALEHFYASVQLLRTGLKLSSYWEILMDRSKTKCFLTESFRLKNNSK